MGIGALVVLAVAAGIVWLQWGEHVELDGRITAVRFHGVTEADTVAMVDCELKNPADVPFEVDEVEAVLQPPSGEPVTGAPVAVMDVPRLVEAYPALRGTGPAELGTLKARDVIGPRQGSKRTLMFQFAALKAADFEARKSLTVKIRERLGAVGVLKEAR